MDPLSRNLMVPDESQLQTLEVLLVHFAAAAAAAAAASAASAAASCLSVLAGPGAFLTRLGESQREGKKRESTRL